MNGLTVDTLAAFLAELQARGFGGAPVLIVDPDDGTTFRVTADAIRDAADGAVLIDLERTPIAD